MAETPKQKKQKQDAKAAVLTARRAERDARKAALLAHLARSRSPEEEIVRDKSKPLHERRAAYKTMVARDMLNPRATFDPKTFDPYDDVEDYEARRRDRVEPPRRLETMGMLPKEIFIGQMIGMYESKQDLYLLIAWLSGRVSDLEDKLQEHGII